MYFWHDSVDRATNFGTTVKHALVTTSGVKKSTSPTPGASNFHIWAS